MGDVTLSEEAAQHAREYLNETSEIREQCLHELKRWLKEESWLNARTEDKYLIPFLRVSKFDLDKAKKRISNFYEMKRDRVEWFKNRDPHLVELQELAKLGVFIPLKKQHDNKLVVIIRTAAHDPTKHKQNDIFKVGKMILDVACRGNENVEIYGITAIFDMGGITFGHYKALTPGMIRNAVFAWQNYYVSPKGLEFVCAPTYINIGLNIFRSFMSEKLKKRVRVHFGGPESLLKVLPQEMIPEDYGGYGESLSALSDYWCEKLSENRGWFLEDEQYKAESRI